ncbi:MAG: deoxyribonuclease IV [Patescibacteria group bacterium]
MRRIGCHVSIAGGITNAPGRAEELGCEVFQMFTRSPQGGMAPKITSEIAEEFKSAMKASNQAECYIHTPYYINFASEKESLRKNSVRIAREELERGSLIGAKYVMTHLGSSKEGDRQKAMELAAQSVKEILHGYKGSTELLLEISAGAGSLMGCTFEELAEIRDKSRQEVGVCIDTAHMFAMGYDIRTLKAVAETEKKISATVGKKSIKLVHANDSKVDLGERKDRHDHIGDGKIGRDGFVHLLSTFDLDFILETEHDKVEQDIVVLKDIRAKIKT